MPDCIPWWITSDGSGDGASEGISLPLIVVVAVLVACRIKVVTTCADCLKGNASPGSEGIACGGSLLLYRRGSDYEFGVFLSQLIILYIKSFEPLAAVCTRDGQRREFVVRKVEALESS